MHGLTDAARAQRLVAEYREAWEPKHAADGFHFDPARAALAVDFFPRFCRLTKGEWAGKPFELLDWQALRVIIPVFGWLRPDGTRRYRQSIIWVPRKNGKALAIDTPIPTSSGWAMMGDLRVGDFVFDDQGELCRVTFATPTQYGRRCFQVQFSDGTSIVADADHRWLAKPKYGSERVVTTLDMTRKLHVGNRPTHVERNWSINVAGALKCKEADLPVEPYVLGAWLGDGHKGDSRITIAYDSPEVKAGIEATGYRVSLVPSSSDDPARTYWIGQGAKWCANAVNARLRRLDLLGNKHIPTIYLRASFNQRLQLLRGIVDTDGHVTPRGQVEIVTVHKALRDGILELVRSLGMKATCSEDTAFLHGRDMGPRYRIWFWAYADVQVATVARKRAAQKPRPAKPTRNSNVKVIAIDEIKSVPVRCIEVDSPSRLYLAGRGLTPTHNTELMAGVSIMHLLGDGETGGEGYCIASKKDQAQILFDATTRMVAMSPDLTKSTELFKSSIYCPKYFAAFKPLSARPVGEHGKGASFAIGDEVHEWADGQLWQFIVQGMGARRQPMEWQISTAGVPNTYGHELWGISQEIDKGVIDDPETLVVIFAADEKDDPHDPETWARANPTYPRSPKRSYMRTASNRAKRSPSDLGEFKRYHLNIWTGIGLSYMPLELWNKNSATPGNTNGWKDLEDQLTGRECFGGVDLSSTQDLTAFSLVFPPRDKNERWSILTRVWMPKGEPGALADRERFERVRYSSWADQGALILTDGNATDHDAVELKIRDDCEKFDVQMIGFDPWQAHGLMTRLGTDGVECVKVPQRYSHMSAAVKAIKRFALDGRLEHGNQPVLRWAMMNVVEQRDAAGNCMMAKNKSRQKIDPAVATATAFALVDLESEADDPSYLESGELVMLG